MRVFGLLLIALIALSFVGIAYHLVTGTPVRDALRRLAGNLLCRTTGHRRRRDTVRKVGTTYLGRCGVCGIRMAREGREGEWRVMNLVPPAGGAPASSSSESA